MANITRNFIKGRMNKSVDERLIPDGEYVDAINVRMGSTEGSEIGVIENTKGNLALTTLQYNNVPLSTSAKCIGAYEDGANETIYWFVHDSAFPVSTEAPLGKIDLIVSYDVQDGIIRYHVISVNDGGGVNTTLNFNPKYLITGVDLVEDLLFFTDNINPPRFINRKSGYPDPNTLGVDYDGNGALLSERLLVIKRPPLYAPIVELQEIPLAEDNYLEDRYICFAYRYRYADGEYSATSPFSDPAFSPKNFDFSTNSYLNDGMINKFNSANVSYNTGGPLVESIELLFKEAQNSTIKVIDKFNKNDRGFSDNSTETYTFTNSNIFTILPNSEILRLYDNVPRFALGQTIMGNRLIYGNYIDGYNLQRNGVDTQISYNVDLISEDSFSNTIQATIDSANYNIPSRGISVTTDGQALFNLTTVKFDLKKGNILTFEIRFNHSSFAGPVTPNAQTQLTDVSFSFTLVRDYTSVYDLATSTEFINTVGNISPKNILPVYAPTPPTSCDGTTFTDIFNCAVLNSLSAPSTPTNSVEKFASGSGVSGSALVGATAYNNNEPIFVGANPSGPLGDTIRIYLPYMRFVDDRTDGANITEDVYEFYKVDSAAVTLSNNDSLKSLHSNRGYEIGMVYMDDYGRSSTALVSDNNSLHVPCTVSSKKNKIQVTIPPRQIAPEWATSYKFVIKPDEENYDVIYSSIYYQSTTDSMAYFLLEGENSRKVEEGDRLIVKKDSSGVTNDCIYATVLEKGTYAANDIITGSVPGTYMKINPNNFNIAQGDDTYRPFYGFQDRRTKGNCPADIAVPCGTKDDPFVDLDIPAGSYVDFKLKIKREGNAFCNSGNYDIDVRIEASIDYSNVLDFLNAKNFQQILDEGIGNVNFIWYGGTFVPSACSVQTATSWWVQGNGATTQSALYFRGIESCGGTLNKQSSISVEFNIYRNDTVLIFETEPQDALPDVWFESADTYNITTDGFHLSGDKPLDQDQTALLPAIVETDFYNCFSFGNGAESYKIRDSIVGKTFNLGNRVYTTSEKEYREAHRFADLTYSGVYSEENNINKLNEFNLGLLNFKPLERTFGPIQKLFGRETDILTLQEDRISYVLQGKNLLSDAGAGSALTSVPEVLGTQIARIEEYGISNNPESFVQWGADKYFTDAKRGAVIQLKGSSAQNEQLNVISEQGMRSWFRNLFIDSFNTQKLGGFDPYMDEYVLSSNDTLKPFVEDCIDCGEIVGSIVIDELNPYEFCVDVGGLVGNLAIEIDIDPNLIVANQPFDIEYTYAGVTNFYSSLNPPVSDVITINKSSVADQKVTLIIKNYSLEKSYIRGITVGCPVAEQITIIPVSITSDANNGEYIHSEYSWTDGTFVSPLHSRLVSFENDSTSNPVVSDYALISGPQGAGVIPADGATVSIICNKINYDNFVFNKNVNNFRYLRSSTLYANNDTDMQALLAAAIPATPIDDTDEPDRYFANFTMPATGSILYLIWDYRLSTEDDLCFGATIEDSCCNC